ncbi:galaxin isoform X2 [Amphiprion ocellaris]|uniref:galaxin isoform X2 n=1 Tax=Amphiprion ocellaris TaxID=80972 RepID=UPI002410F099|nr:galaxin isoform X2 [Amphiprion ocellaris]
MHQKGSKMVTVMVRLGWLICGFVAMCEPALRANASPNCYRKTCHGIAYDSCVAVCCGNQLHVGAGLSCCGDQPFNPATASCCNTTHGHFKAQVTQGLSANVSRCCGLKAYDELNEICCGSTIVGRPAAAAECCGKEAYDVETELCCGGTIQVKNSADHLCCSDSQFNFRTECCRWNDDGSHEISSKPKNSQCDPATSGVQYQKPELQPHCTEPNTHRCGSLCYDPNKRRCCERKEIKPQWNPASGQHDAAFSVYDPDTHVCCDGHVKPGMDQFHGSPGQHCCGTEVYQPRDEICCDGHRYPKEENLHCCGIKAYNIKDPKMKCCAGTLYNVAHLRNRGDVTCCGSILRNPQEQKVCCSSKDNAVLYSGKTGFGCCGHLYFNLSLWSCCAESLSPVQRSGQQQRKMTECRLQSVNNLKETHLCREIYIGTVQSVSPNSIVFSSVLKINGTNGNVHPVPFHYVLATPNRCNTPKLILGKFYYFNDVNVVADFNHDTALQSLYFLLNKCSP